jgi:phage major head subunit gpT-like protein
LAQAIANSSGEFDFGALKEGHYTLQVKGQGLGDGFDVEITNKVPATKQITIDISPIAPDCTGGHEIEVQSEKK